MLQSNKAALVAWLAVAGRSLGKPPIAEPIGASPRVFRVPMNPELALMEVGSVDELLELNCGFALLSADGYQLIAFLGKSAEYAASVLNLLPTQVDTQLGLNNSGGYPWSRPHATSGMLRSLTSFPFIGNRDYHTFNPSNTNYGDPASIEKLFSGARPANFDTNNSGKGFVSATKSGISAGSISTPAFPALEPLTRLVAVLNKADYGTIRGSRGRNGSAMGLMVKGGFASNMVTFGNMKAPMDKVASEWYKDASIDSKLRAVLPMAFDRMIKSGVWDYEPKYALVTHFGDNSRMKYSAEPAQFGLALTNPSRVGSTGPSAAVMCGNEPSFAKPIGIPDMTVHFPKNVPSSLMRDIYTWHCLGMMMNSDLSITAQIPPNPSGSWDQYIKLRGVLDNVRSPLEDLVIPDAASLPQGQTVETFFNPSLSEDDPMDDVVRLFNDGGVVCGDAFWKYRIGVRDFYKEWERCVHDVYGD